MESMDKAWNPARQAAAPKSARGVEIKSGARVSEHRLANGMRLLVAERKGTPSVASVLYFPVGARNETGREAGVSHFLEHMMFKGTKRYGKGEVDRLTTEAGGQNNAFTGYDHTAYWFKFAADRWLQALDIEADRMHGLLLDPVEFDSERAVVLEELAMGEDEPWRVLVSQVEAMLFGRHPYGRPIIGYSDVLEAMGPAEMRNYYQRFYHPGNATLVVAGDVSASSVLREVRARFGKLKSGPKYAQADCQRPAFVEPLGPQRMEMNWDDEGRRLLMAWPTVAVGVDDDYDLDVLLVVLTSGRMSRLQRRLVFTSGMALSVSASNDTRVEGGAFWLYAECAQGTKPADLERVIDEEIVRLASERITPAELKRAKDMMRSSEAFEGETVSDLAEQLGEWAVDADWRMSFDGSVRHSKVTAARVQATAAKYLGARRRVTGWCLPSGESLASLSAPPTKAPRKKAKKKVGKRS